MRGLSELRPTRHRIRNFGGVLPSQSLGVVLKTLKLTQQKWPTQEQIVSKLKQKSKQNAKPKEHMHNYSLKMFFSKHKPHAGRRIGRKMKKSVFAPMTLTSDLWSWPSNSPERGTKHVFCVSLAQIRSAVPEIFHTQAKNHGLTARKTEPAAVHCVRQN